MSTTTFVPPVLPAAMPPAARTVLQLLQRLPLGVLDLQAPDGTCLRCGVERPGEPRAAIQLRDWQACGAAWRRGDIGFAQAYIDGHWSTPDLPALLRLLLANREAISRLVYGSWWGGLVHRARHLLNRNSPAGSRRNIHAHYDLGNAFYRTWLDDTLSYSSAWFEGDPTRPLADAQRAKMRRALRQCGVRPGERLLEVGCGWGALAEAAAVEFGAQIVGLTLSTEQLAEARERIARAGLGERVDLRLQDYRALQAPPFDAVVSVEMFEAVGQAYWPQYFAMLSRHLKPGGRACIQCITIREDLFERYRRGSDFIQQYVFPGGLLPSPAAFRDAARAGGFEVVDEFAFGADYAETLRRWRHRFIAQEAAIRSQGFDLRFLRLWEFYLAYCEAAFDSGNTDVLQVTLARR